MKATPFAVAILFLSSVAAVAAPPKVLVYTRNFTPDGKGYVHGNIASSVAAIQKLGAENGFSVDAGDDPKLFTDANLKQYATLIFSNSNNVAFDTDAQRDAFKHFIQHGGGFVGIHSASGSERQWDYFAQVLGGRFVVHPAMQPFTVHVADPAFLKGQKDFEMTDECYFTDHLSADLHVILTTDRTKLQSLDKVKNDLSTFPNPLPLAWYHQFDGGREFYLALGHRNEEYSDPLFLSILKRGILWSMQR